MNRQHSPDPVEREIAVGQQTPSAGYLKVVLNHPVNVPAGNVGRVYLSIHDDNDNTYAEVFQTLAQDAWSIANTKGAWATVLVPMGKNYSIARQEITGVSASIVFLKMPV